MKTFGLVGLVFGISAVVAYGQPICAPVIQSQKSFGTRGSERARAVRQTPDGGFVIGGIDAQFSGVGGNRTSQNFGWHDYWIVRTDPDGNKLWDRSYGGTEDDLFAALDQTADGGFIFAGSSRSGVSGIKTSTNYGNADYWIVRTDAAGDVLWDRSFGGDSSDYLSDIRQTADGGFVLAGWSISATNESKTAPQLGNEDFWIVRLDASGHKLWDKTYGGIWNDNAYAIRQTADGGFLIGGYTEHGGFGQFDYRVVRIDADGNKLWDKFFGGLARDALLSLELAADGGCIVGGWSQSLPSGNKTSVQYGAVDFWVLRLDAQGNKVWERSYGGIEHDTLESIAVTMDGGFLLAGYSISPLSGSKTAPLLSDYHYDFWVVRTDANGNELWQASFGGSGAEFCHTAAQTADGGYVLAGESSSVDGDRRGPNFGSYDFWLVKLSPENPNDCDHDGVPNAQDQCLGIALGSIVNAQGCSIEQLCPCEMDSHGEYLACVREQARAFQQAGLISNVRRRQLIENARAANCPPSTGSGDKFIFGLPHRAINDAQLDLMPAWFDGVLVRPKSENPEEYDEFGVSIALGEADSGLFIYPDGNSSNYGESWFFDATAIGRRAGDEREDIVSRIRVRKPFYEEYPVSVDLSPLRPESVTIQIISNNTVLGQSTTTVPFIEFTVTGSARLEPRGNPYWRMPDGSVGALIEFTSPYVFSTDAYFSIGTPDGPEEAVRADKIYVRANRPRHEVQYVSRVDAVVGGGVPGFEVRNERLGVFGHAHQALGAVFFQASRGRLQIKTLEDFEPEDYAAVLVEAPRAASRLELDFEAMALEDPGAAIALYPAGLIDSDDIMFSVLSLQRESDHLAFRCDYQVLFVSASSNTPSVRIEAFRNGRLNGSAIVSGATLSGTFALIDDRAPAITSCRATINSNGVPTLGISFGRVTSFSAADGLQLSGNHFRITPINPAQRVDAMSAMTVEFVKQPSITIVGERSTAAPPVLSIQPSGELMLSWTDRTHLYALEAAESPSGPFVPVTDEVETNNDQHRLILPISNHGSRFFRLAAPAD